jgi:hypothetical protein
MVAARTTDDGDNTIQEDPFNRVRVAGLDLVHSLCSDGRQRSRSHAQRQQCLTYQLCIQTVDLS